MPLPPSTIIVCTRNRLDYLKTCLESLSNLDYPGYELIIVDDCSDDGTSEYLQGLSSKNLKTIRNKQHSGKSYSRNQGIMSAKYDILAFTDDDCQADKNWLKTLISDLINTNTDFTIGQVIYVNERHKGRFPERCVNNTHTQWPMTSNIAFKRSVFKSVGFFNPAFDKYNNEDTELAIRAVSKGHSYSFNSEAKVYHQAMLWTPTTLLHTVKNPSVWIQLKKMYPQHYLTFQPKIWFGWIIYPQHYLYLLLSPILIPLLFIRYLWHGKRDWLVFFTKWPLLLMLQRLEIYRESLKQKIWMV